ncbi:hypothetical protein BOTBODRAFT_587868 [Botryobasidium botryosum FD-172 SS1]|uniref:Uncharacterized protein n=1 Tax=Botryobasidium botryosum (strain FD-172 SS1) TaxID=930990 RepID=A0A067M011_BOTB1|nr:hypothetical protein BOTBODRAFT_587868 [Botryobasidium botryosum FD-172 SS1]
MRKRDVRAFGHLAFGWLCICGRALVPLSAYLHWVKPRLRAATLGALESGGCTTQAAGLWGCARAIGKTTLCAWAFIQLATFQVIITTLPHLYASPGSLGVPPYFPGACILFDISFPFVRI